MVNIVYRETVNPPTPGTSTAKLSPLTNTELDGNFRSVSDAIDLKASLVSPVFTGAPLVPTAAVGNNTGQAASTKFVQDTALVTQSTALAMAVALG